MEILLDGVQALIAEPGRIAMILIGCVLMYLGIKKEYEPTLLVPMGLGTILVNIPASGVLAEPGRIAMILIGCVLMYLGIKKEYEPTLLVPMGLGTILVNIPASGVLMTGGRIAMILIGCVLMYLGIKKEYEPTLLVPMGLGTILVNIPASGVLMTGTEPGPFQILFDAGIETELFPLLLFIGIGAMIDFGPLLANPFLLLFGAAAQFGIFFVTIVATGVFGFDIADAASAGIIAAAGPLLANPFLLLFGAAAQFGIFFVTIVATGVFGFDIADAASAGIIAAADGPTSIFVANSLGSKYMGAIMVAAYSYMALVPIIQPIAIKACTTKKERAIRMTYRPGQVSQTAKILFPVTICVVAGLIAPVSLPLVGFLMFGNLLRECGVLNSLSASAQNDTILVNIPASGVLMTGTEPGPFQILFDAGIETELFPLLLFSGIGAMIDFGPLLVNLISIRVGLCVSVKMEYSELLQFDTLIIMGLGLICFIMYSVGGVMFSKFLNLFRKETPWAASCSPSS